MNINALKETLKSCDNSVRIDIMNFLQQMTNEMTNENTNEMTNETANETANELQNLEIKQKNEDKCINLANMLFNTKNKVTKHYDEFFIHESLNACISAPTQVGKSEATINLIKVAVQRKIPIIVSNDNKTDQQEQLFQRISEKLIGSEVMLIKASDKNLTAKIRECVLNKKMFVCFSLDNANQIQKVKDAFASINGYNKEDLQKYKSLALIHDEGDVIQKNRDVENILAEQPKSHQRWLEFNNYIGKDAQMQLKRIFVTATPENIYTLYPIEHKFIIQLEIPSNYRGYKHIIMNDLKEEDDISKALQVEIRRIKANLEINPVGETILYCCERNAFKGENSHGNLLKTMSHMFPDITIHTYNSHGITLYTQNENLKTILKNTKTDTNKKIKYTIDENGIINLDKFISIKLFYTACKNAKESIVVTIGKDLINRGISYVSEGDNPLAATVMIYKPGNRMHSVGDNQTIGRITGCARPNLQRILYAPKKVYENYINYNKNQEDFHRYISENPNRCSSDAFISHKFEHKLTKPIDRKNLNIKIQYTEKYPDTDTGKMQELIDTWWDKNTDTNKILHYIIENQNGVTFNEFQEDCEISNHSNWWNHMTTSGKEYRLVYMKTQNNIMKLRPEALFYINLKKST